VGNEHTTPPRSNAPLSIPPRPSRPPGSRGFVFQDQYREEQRLFLVKVPNLEEPKGSHTSISPGVDEKRLRERRFYRETLEHFTCCQEMGHIQVFLNTL